MGEFQFRYVPICTNTTPKCLALDFVPEAKQRLVVRIPNPTYDELTRSIMMIRKFVLIVSLLNCGCSFPLPTKTLMGW